MTARLIRTLHFSRLSATRAAVRVRAPAIAGLAMLCALPGFPAAAQRPAPHVDRFTVNDGLIQNWVDAIAQDSGGFIWTGTARGLQRFDGYTFLSYSAIDPTAPPELDGAIKALVVDGAGNLWIATDRAIFKRERSRPVLTTVQLERPFKTWALSSAGELWIIDSGAVSRINTVSETPLPVTVFEHPSLHACGRLLPTRDGDVWLSCSTDAGARTIRLEPITARTTEYPTRLSSSASGMLEDSAGRIWLGAYEGLEVIDSESRSPPVIAGSPDGPVRALRPAGDDGILVLTESEANGMVSLLDYAGRVVKQWGLPRDALYVTDLIVDREGGYWITTSTAGVFRLDPGRGFEHASSASRPPLPLASDFVTALHECAGGDLWIGTIRGGAYRFSSDWNLVTAYRHDARNSRGLASDEVWDIKEDRAGNHWISTVSGICRVAASGVRCHSPEKGDPGGTQLVQDAYGWFWFARSTAGVISFNPATERFGVDPGIGYAMSLYADVDSDHLWIASDRLLRARTAHGRIVGMIDTVPATVSPGSRIYEVYRDRGGTLWLASTSGLQRWDDSAGGFIPVEVRELRGVTVFSVEEDQQGRLWLGTGHGIVLYSPATGFTRRYRRRDGVGNDEFNRRAAVQTRSGDMVFGGTQGLTVFRPDLVTALREMPPVAFTRWSAVTSGRSTGSLFETGRELRLRTGDRAITIEFSALTFAAGPAKYYRYRLEGLDEKWLETSERAVTYGALPAGQYLLRVQAAAGGENVWHEPGAQLLLHVVPPFWRTTWFSVLLVLVLLAGISILHRTRLRQALATERLRVRISRDLHDDIGSGLSSIALLSDAIGGNDAISERERTQLTRIGKSARRMVEDLREIVWAIDPEADRWQSVVSRMRDVADDLLPGARVSFHAPRPDEMSGTIAMAERRDLFLIYKEMLHNVARHAGASSVEIRLVAHRDRIELAISDDGRGFDGTAVRGGTGLRSMQERAARLGGRLEFTTGNGGGTTARLALRRT